jgi:hypothetical protein
MFIDTVYPNIEVSKCQFMANPFTILSNHHTLLENDNKQILKGYILQQSSEFISIFYKDTMTYLKSR